jgi:hypothetical protein
MVLKIAVPEKDWIPLARAPFLFQKGVEHIPGEEDLVSFKCLEALLIETGADSATIDHEKGLFRLKSREWSIDTHPSQLLDSKNYWQPELAPLPRMDIIATVWNEMVDQFYEAVLEGKCQVVGQTGSPINPEYTSLAPNIFEYVRTVDWHINRLTLTTGETIFSVHVTAPSLASTTAQSNKVKQPKPAVEACVETLELIYGSGAIPNGLPNGFPKSPKTIQERIKIDAHRQGVDLKRLGSHDTVMRALGIRKN